MDNSKWQADLCRPGVYARYHRRDGRIYVKPGAFAGDYDTLPRFTDPDRCARSRAAVALPKPTSRQAKEIKQVRRIAATGILAMSEEQVRLERSKVLVPVRLTVSEDSNH